MKTIRKIMTISNCAITLIAWPLSRIRSWHTTPASQKFTVSDLTAPRISNNLRIHLEYVIIVLQPQTSLDLTPCFEVRPAKVFGATAANVEGSIIFAEKSVIYMSNFKYTLRRMSVRCRILILWRLYNGYVPIRGEGVGQDGFKFLRFRPQIPKFRPIFAVPSSLPDFAKTGVRVRTLKIKISKSALSDRNTGFPSGIYNLVVKAIFRTL